MYKDNKIKGAYASLTGFRRAIPIILFALALFLGLCFIAPGGVGLGKYVADFLKGLFSVGGYFVPFLLMIHAIFYPQDTLKKRTVSRLIFSITVLFFFSAFLHALKSLGAEMAFTPKEFYNAGKTLSGGGFFGGILGFALIKVFGPVGLIIIAALIFALYITYFFANGKSALAKLLLFILDKISALFGRFSKKRKEEKLLKREKAEAKNEAKRIESETKRIEAEAKRLDAKAPRISEKHSDLYDDEFFSVNNGFSELKIEELGINEKKNPKEMELFPKLQDKVLHESENVTAMKDEPKPSEEPKKSSPLLFDEVEPEKADPEFDDDEFTESADSIFAKEFDPFNFASNAELAKRQTANTREAMNEYIEPIKTVSEDRINEARRAEFEARKKALLEAEARRREIEEEAEKQRKIQELLREEPAPEKATYTSSSGTLYDESERVSFAESEPEELTYSEEKSFSEPFTITDMPTFKDDADDDEKETITVERSPLSFYSEASDDFDDEEEDGEDGDGSFELGFGEEEMGDEEEFGFDNEIPEELQNPDVISYRERFSVLKSDVEEKQEALIVTENVGIDEDEDMPEITADDDEGPVYVPFDMPKAPKEEKAEPEKPKAKAPDYSNYKKPPIDLLKKGSLEIDDNLNEETTANGEKLIQTLSEFNVRASIRSVDVGPRITRYEIVPAKGVRVNSVINLFDDISLSLAAEGIRMEAPIPGKAAIGVEIPNKKPQMVLLRDLIEREEFQSSESTTMACFGKDVTGNAVLGDIAKMPHMLIAGATGMGKSVCINSIMISMLYRARPDELKFIMIDPKMVEFNGYNGIPHLLIPVIIDVKQAAGALMWAVEQMEKRYEMFLKYSVRNLDGYNEKMRADPSLGEPLPKIVIVIDELNDLMLQARKPVEDLIMRIAQKARAAGIHLIIGTQRPSVDVITGVIKANIPSRIACKVASFTDSKTILEQAGAEKLLNNGDMLFWPVGKPKPTRVQGAFVSDGEVEKVMAFLKSQNKGTSYDEQALEEINRAAQKCSKGGKGDDDDEDDGESGGVGIFNDPQFLEAVELAIKQGKIATSLIQRKIGVGYGKAAKFIDMMEDQGFVSEPNGQKPREVLITKDEWHEILSRRSLD